MSRVEAREDEPLLGRPGDASQHDGQMGSNLWLGTAVLAQAGIWILVATVWAAVFKTEFQLFSWHPLVNSLGLLLTTQAILILQPTQTASQKRRGTLYHAGLNAAGSSLLIAGLVVIEVNKIGHAHFGTWHNYLGVLTYALVELQALVGFTQYWVPQLYGGVDNAKAVWKYHRMSGYVTLVLGLLTICSAADTPANYNMLHIDLWKLAVASVLVLFGVLPRIKLQKLGLKTAATQDES